MLKFIDLYFCLFKSDNINGHFTSTRTAFLSASPSLVCSCVLSVEPQISGVPTDGWF
jgi:hypothetical protein